MNRKDFIETFNRFYNERVPFVFLVNFELDGFVLFKKDEALQNNFWFDTRIDAVYPSNFRPRDVYFTEISPVPFEEFKTKFDKVMHHLRRGDTYLLNLTFATPVELNTGLKDVFFTVKSPFKVYYDDKFVFFSPEFFVIIENGKIRTFPMKGTADASVPSARQKLLENEKEIYEHNTVVDLLRNDISYASINVEVKRFRYVDEIETGKGRLLQVSSEISGDLDERWYDNPAGTLLKMLPAGSVTGAPKSRTVQIIGEVEDGKRGFYTGISGVFDGKRLATSVNIRYIEQRNGRFFYRSGGGITAFSDPENEYAEYINKIYLPVV